MYNEIVQITQVNYFFSGLTLLIMGGIALASAAASFYFFKTADSNQQNMNPTSLDKFGVTQAGEGQVLPLIYGKCKLVGNIIWYGNLETEAVKEKQGGGKGGKKKKTTTGYKYYLDVWQSIGMGKLTISKTYIQDKEKVVECDYSTINDGTQITYSTVPGGYANKIAGVSHIFYKRWFLGENSSTVPVIKFVVERTLDTSLTYENLVSGSNPAAIIKDILLRSGVIDGDIDDTGFQDAANFWNDKEYGLNIIFQKQQDVAQMVEYVLGFVDGVLFLDQNGKFKLKAFKDIVVIADTLDQDDFLDFSFSRFGYDELDNDFRATFVDEGQDFSERVINVQNPAVIRLTGNVKQQSIDLTAFRDVDLASKRLTEMMKRLSYPLAEIEFKTSMVFSELEQGDVITINHSDYSITNMDFRIIDISYEEIDKNELTFKAQQIIENIHDDNYEEAGGTQWSKEEYTPIDLTKVRVFEMSYNSLSQNKPSYLILMSREIGQETGAEVIYSSDTDYRTFSNIDTYAQAGILDEDYIFETNNVDDFVGILYTPYKEDYAPEFDSISRADLFGIQRIIIIDDEMMAFQTVTPEGVGSYRLTGIIRGVLGTTKALHTSGTQVFLADIRDNLIINLTIENFSIKLLPYVNDTVLDEGDATAHNIILEYLAKKPREISRIVAVRVGSTISLQLFPSTPEKDGAGNNGESVTDQAPPFAFNGDFVISYDAIEVIRETDSFDIIKSGAVDITIKHRLNAFISASLIITVGASDGTYIK